MIPKTIQPSQSLQNVRSTTSSPVATKSGAETPAAKQSAVDGEPQPLPELAGSHLQSVDKQASMSSPSEAWFAPAETIELPDSSPSGGDAGAPADAPAVPTAAPQTAVTDKQVTDARNQVAKSRAELKSQEKALKLEVRIAAFMASMQTFIDKLAEKYGVSQDALAPLKHLFAQAQHKCQQKVVEREQQVKDASEALIQRTKEAESLATLARGTKADVPPATPPVAAGTDTSIQNAIAALPIEVQPVVTAATGLAKKVSADDPAPVSDTELDDALAQLKREIDNEQQINESLKNPEQSGQKADALANSIDLILNAPSQDDPPAALNNAPAVPAAAGLDQKKPSEMTYGELVAVAAPKT